MRPDVKARLAAAEDQARALLGQFAGDRRTLIAYSALAHSRSSPSCGRLKGRK